MGLRDWQAGRDESPAVEEALEAAEAAGGEGKGRTGLTLIARMPSRSKLIGLEKRRR